MSPLLNCRSGINGLMIMSVGDRDRIGGAGSCTSAPMAATV